METKNLSQDEISRMLSAMQVSNDDEADADAPSGDGRQEDMEPKPDEGQNLPDEGDGEAEIRASEAADRAVDENQDKDRHAGDSKTAPDGPADEVSGSLRDDRRAADAAEGQAAKPEGGTPAVSEDNPRSPSETEAFEGLDETESGQIYDDQSPDDSHAPEQDDPAESEQALVSAGPDETLHHANAAQTNGAPDDPDNNATEPAVKAPPVNKGKKKRGKKTRKNQTAVWVTMAACALLLLVPIWLHISNVQEEQAIKEEMADAEKEKQPDLTGQPEAEEAEVQTEQDPMKLAFEKQLSEMKILREELLIKEGEIEELKQEYRLAIHAVEDEIIQIKNRQRIRSLENARKNNAIALNLQTIQRRNAYIKGLDRPADWLRWGSETLLFQSRKSRIDLLMADNAEGVDLAGLMQENDLTIEEYTPNPEKLAVAVKKQHTPGIDDIWRQVLQREKESILTQLVKTDIQARHTAGSQNADRQIWNDICNGNFSRKAELSRLSPEAARCLANWKEADLFLNRITNLSPEAARHLFTWKGNWICLNGFEKLSPDVARHLFQWDGKWISLNGLAHVPFESTMYLTGWKGERLELMGLKPEAMRGDQLALKHMAQWENRGGKLYVNDRVRQLIRKVK